MEDFQARVSNARTRIVELTGSLGSLRAEHRTAFGEHPLDPDRVARLGRRIAAIEHECDVVLRKIGKWESSIPTAPSKPNGAMNGHAVLNGHKAPISTTATWTAEIVLGRLEEAHQVIRRLPIRVRPNGYVSGWPSFQSMTPAEQAQLVNELQLTNMLKEYYANRNRVTFPPAAEIVARCEEAVAWPMIYLKDDSELAQILSGWVSGVIKSQETPRLVDEAAWRIARGLTRDRVRVRY